MSQEPAVTTHTSESATRTRVLVVASEQCVGPVLKREILQRDQGGGVNVLMVAPALTDRLHYWMSDTDSAIRQARERLDSSIGKISSEEMMICGEVGDPDPLQALEDAIGTFKPHEIIIVTHPIETSNWLERAVVEQARHHYSLPVAHIEVDRAHDHVEVNPKRVVPEWLVREQHARRDWFLLGLFAVLAIVGTWTSYVFYLVEAPLWLTSTWVLVADLGFKFVALPVVLWILFQRRARADRLDY